MSVAGGGGGGGEWLDKKIDAGGRWKNGIEMKYLSIVIFS